MLKAINTKLLVGILAALTAIAALLVHQHQVSERAAASAAQAAAILQQQQNDTDAAKKHDAELWDAVHKQRQKNNANPVNGSKTWKTYVP